MDDDQLREWFEKHDDEFIKFEKIRVADRLHANRYVCGILKVLSLMKKPAAWSMHAEHDEVYLGSADDMRPDVTEADVVYLHRCGVRMGEYGLCMFT